MQNQSKPIDLSSHRAKVVELYLACFRDTSSNAGDDISELGKSFLASGHSTTTLGMFFKGCMDEANSKFKRND